MTKTTDRLVCHPIPAGEPSQPFGADPNTYGAAGMLGHNGIDFDAPEGTPVFAAAAGRVVHAGPGDAGPWSFLLGNSAGTCILVEHGIPLDVEHFNRWGDAGPTLTGYAHLSELNVRAGDRVRAGQRIGGSGSTGWVGGPHLHFEVLTLGPEREVDTSNGYLGRVDPSRLLRLVR